MQTTAFWARQGVAMCKYVGEIVVDETRWRAVGNGPLEKATQMGTCASNQM
jgi:hypothetical protein